MLPGGEAPPHLLRPQNDFCIGILIKSASSQRGGYMVLGTSNENPQEIFVFDSSCATPRLQAKKPQGLEQGTLIFLMIIRILKGFEGDLCDSKGS